MARAQYGTSLIKCLSPNVDILFECSSSVCDDMDSAKDHMNFHYVYFWLCFPYTATQRSVMLCHLEILASDS